MTGTTAPSSAAILDAEIPMRDGTVLRANVYLPSPLPTGGVPALLTRTAYGKDSPMSGAYPPLATRGYAVIMEDKRGRYASDGEYTLLRDDADGVHKDGFDTVEWIADQPWSNGEVAVFGLSYLGATAIGAAISQPPHLKAGIVLQPSTDEYTDRTFTDGVLFLQNVIDWAALPFVAPSIIEKLPAAEQAAVQAELEEFLALGDARYSILPLIDTPYFRRLEMVWGGPLAHRENEAYFADNRVGGAEAAAVRVPLLHVGSWFDFFTRNSVRQFELVSGLSRAGADQRLVMGPWAHASLAVGSVAGVEFPGSAIDENAMVAAWADRWLGDAPSGAADWPRAIIYVLGANRWRAEPAWPIPGTQTRSLALRVDGSASFDPDEERGVRTFRDDPAAPYGASPAVAGPRDVAVDLGGDNVAFYTTERCSEPYEITGWPRAVLHASTTGTDADWLVELHVVGADHSSRLVNEGITRSRYRHGRTAPRAVEPGVVEELAVHLRPISIVIQPGERLRVVVAGGKFPAYERNPGAFVDLNTATEADFVVSERTIVSGPGLSRIELPIVPAGAGGEWIDNPWPA